VPEFNEQQEIITEIVKHGEWQVKDVAGEQEVVLTKKFGPERYDLSRSIRLCPSLHADDEC
jgi:complement component 1 Q subcomponent-binding protein